MSTPSTYPPPTAVSSIPHPLGPPTHLLPLLPPPLPTSLPKLPPRPPLPPSPKGFSLTSHIIPAAYPRQYMESSGRLSRRSEPFRTTPPRANESSEDRKRRVLPEALTAVRIRFDATGVKTEDIDSGENGKLGHPLWLAVQRLKRDTGDRKGEDGVTLIVTHANGFHKESWLPTIENLLALGESPSTANFGVLNSNSTTPSQSSKEPTKIRIDDIWLIDDLHHGASVDLNEGILGPVHSWSDGGRDIVNFIEHILPISGEEIVDGQLIPWRKSRRDGKGKKVIGIGHSFGGNAMVQAAHARPDLFHGIFLVEPMCPPILVKRETLGSSYRWPLVGGALRRRSVWPSRDAASSSMRKLPFFASWDDKVFTLYISHGLVPLNPNEPEGAVQLATPPWCEAAVFAEPTGLGEGWDKLSELEMPVGFVMAGTSTATHGDEVTREMVWRPKRSKNERMMDAGHLVIQEKPHEVGEAMWRFIGNLMGEIADPAERNTPPRARL